MVTDCIQLCYGKKVGLRIQEISTQLINNHAPTGRYHTNYYKDTSIPFLCQLNSKNNPKFYKFKIKDLALKCKNSIIMILIIFK